MSDLSFSLHIKQRTISLEKEDGSKEEITLRELTGSQRDRFLNGMAARMKHAPDGKPVGIKDFDGMQADLLVLSLTNAEGLPLKKSEIQAWPASVQGAIFKEAQSMSALNQVEGVEMEAAKND